MLPEPPKLFCFPEAFFPMLCFPCFANHLDSKATSEHLGRGYCDGCFERLLLPRIRADERLSLDSRRAIASKIRSLIAYSCYSPGEISDVMGISIAALSNITRCSDVRTPPVLPTVKTVVLLCEALRVTPNVILNYGGL